MPDKAKITQTAGPNAIQISNVEGDAHIHTSPNHRSSPPPRLLPPRAKHFVGREEELQWLDQALYPGRVITLCGPGGIGKTALATEALHHLPPERFPSGIVFYSFYGNPDADNALEAIALAYGEEPRSGSKAAARRALSGRKALLILDGAEQANNLRDVLDVRGDCGILITSRRRIDTLNGRKDIKPLPQHSAITLLREWCKENIDDDTAQQICQQVDCLPLAVRLAGRYLAQTGETAAEYLRWLQAAPLEALDRSQWQEDSVPALLKKSLAQVSGQARRAMSIIGCLAQTPFNCEPVAAALKLSLNQVHEPLGELESYGLLMRSNQCYKVSHALVHTYARKRVPLKAKALRRIASYYTKSTETEVEKGLEGYQQLNTCRPHLMSVLDQCARNEQWQMAKNLAWAMDEYLEKQGHWTERIKALEIGQRAAQQLQDRPEQATFFGLLGRTYRALGQIPDAINFYDRALDIAREINDRKEEGRWLGHMGSAYRNLGKYKKATELYKQALHIAREVRDREKEGVQLGRLGICYQLQGKPEKAIGEHEEALKIAREIGGHRQESVQLGFLGRAHRALGQIDQAYKSHTNAWRITQAEGHRQEESVQLGCLGLVCRVRGQITQARDYHQDALKIAREIGNRWEEEYNLGHLGYVYYELGEYGQAIKHYLDSQEKAIEINDLRGEGVRLSNLSAVCHTLGWDEKATECQQEAKLLFDTIDDYLGQSYCLLQASKIELAAGKLTQAQELGQKAHNLDRLETNYRAALILGIISLHQKKPTAAQKAFIDSATKCQKLLDRTHTLYQARYALATALLGQAVCDPDWTQKEKRTELLIRALYEYDQALKNCSERGVIYSALCDLELIQNTTIEGLEPALERLKHKINLEQHEQHIQDIQQTQDIAPKIVNQHNQAFRRWRLGLRYQESEPARAKKLMLAYVNYLRENDIPGLPTAAERLTYVHEMIPPDPQATAKRIAYLKEIGHPDPQAGAKNVARMKVQNHLEYTLAILEEIQSPHTKQIRDLLAKLAAESTNNPSIENKR
ncbi:MAG: ATP-binding protein [Chloroflexi bacterium]|nr:ATP-binding protein [Chloroflexota bacterium]